MKAALTTQSIRRNNKYNLLYHIVKKGLMQRIELAESLELSNMTVKKIVEQLLADGIIEERPMESPVGRKPKALIMARNYGVFFCLDLSSTSKIRFYLYHLDGTVLVEQSMALQTGVSYLEGLERVFAQMLDCLAQQKLALLGVAASVPSIYYQDTDELNDDLISGFKGLHLKALLKAHFATDNILIMHDVKAAAVAEYQRKPCARLFYLYIGEGVAGVYLQDGEILSGEYQAAGEIGQCLVPQADGPVILEKLISTNAILERLQENGLHLDFNAALALYGQQEALSHVFDLALEHCTLTIYNICWMLNPASLIIDSAYPTYARFILERAEEKLVLLRQNTIQNDVDLLLPAVSNHSNMRGLLELLLESWLESVTQ